MLARVLCTDTAPTLGAADILDLICLGVLAFGFVQGAMRGFSGELSRLAGMILSFLIGLWIYEPVGALVQTHTRLADPRAAQALAFTVVAVLVFVIMILLRIGLRRCIRLVVDQPTDAVLGMLTGTLRCGVLLAIVFLVMTMVPHEDANRLFAQESRVGRAFERLLPALRKQVQALPAAQRAIDTVKAHVEAQPGPDTAPSPPPAPPSAPPTPPTP